MELILLTSGLCLYLLAILLNIHSSFMARITVLLGLLLHGSFILLRWQSVGHGPYLGLFDSLSSNLWVQLFLLMCLVFWRSHRKRLLQYGLFLSAPFIVWLLFTPLENIDLPPTYYTNWFYLHLYAGKLAYALLFMAITLILCSWRDPSAPLQKQLQAAMLGAFICHTLLLFAGANWAFLAWGTYWDWNPLEIWSLLTWIGFGLYFHRFTLRDNDWLPSAQGIAIIIYLFAILGFYGVPFLSRATHQGLV